MLGTGAPFTSQGKTVAEFSATLTSSELLRIVGGTKFTFYEKKLNLLNISILKSFLVDPASFLASHI